MEDKEILQQTIDGLVETETRLLREAEAATLDHIREKLIRAAEKIRDKIDRLQDRLDALD